MKFLLSLSILVFGVGFASSVSANYKARMKVYIKPSVLRVEIVPAPNSDVDPELCRNMGTGFIVDSRHVVTASHVIDFNKDCDGSTVIVAKSFYFPQLSFLLEEVKRREDVALLRVVDDKFTLSGTVDLETGRPESLCAATLANSDIYGVSGDESTFRYGIASQQAENFPVATPTNIGEENTPHRPKTIIMPNNVDYGESGGPVVSGFQVVGIIREKTETQTVALMSPISFLLNILQDSDINLQSGEACNPAPSSTRRFVDIQRVDQFGYRTQLSEEGEYKIGDTASSQRLIDRYISDVILSESQPGATMGAQTSTTRVVPSGVPGVVNFGVEPLVDGAPPGVVYNCSSATGMLCQSTTTPFANDRDLEALSMAAESLESEVAEESDEAFTFLMEQIYNSPGRPVSGVTASFRRFSETLEAVVVEHKRETHSVSP